MKRRELLELVTTAGVFLTGAAMASEAPPTSAEHVGHDHAAMTGRYAALIADTTDCINKGEACLTHCLTLLGTGTTELAACARTVQDTLAACTALRQLAAANSPYVGRLAGVVADVCAACDMECRKHLKHAVCAECGAACARCAKECQKAAA